MFRSDRARFGSNPGGMLTTAKREGSSWIINGEKTWITNGSMADVAVVWARTDDGVQGFLVEKGTPGYSTSDIHGKLIDAGIRYLQPFVFGLPHAGGERPAFREGFESCS